MEAVSGLLFEEFENASAADPGRAQELAQRDGYLFVRDMVPAHIVMALRAVVLEYACKAGWIDTAHPVAEARKHPEMRFGAGGEAAWHGLQVHARSSDALWALGDYPAIQKAIEAATGRSAFLYLNPPESPVVWHSCRVQAPLPDPTVQPHQDGNWVGSHGGFWTAWVPLGECPVELGPVAVLPGSHRGGLLEHRGSSLFDAGVAVPDSGVWHAGGFACGDVLLFSHHTVHRALPNVSGNRLRLSIDLRYGLGDAA